MKFATWLVAGLFIAVLPAVTLADHHGGGGHGDSRSGGEAAAEGEQQAG